MLHNSRIDPASPKANAWIARAHYKQLVTIFEEWKKNRAGRPESEWELYKASDEYKDDPEIDAKNQPQVIESLFDHNTGELNVD